MAKAPPISLKPGVERLALIDAYATDHGLTRHGALLALLDEGLERVNGPKTPTVADVVEATAPAAATARAKMARKGALEKLAEKGHKVEVASNLPTPEGARLAEPRGDTYPSWMRGKPKEGKK